MNKRIRTFKFNQKKKVIIDMFFFFFFFFFFSNQRHLFPGKYEFYTILNKNLKLKNKNKNKNKTKQKTTSSITSQQISFPFSFLSLHVSFHHHRPQGFSFFFFWIFFKRNFFILLSAIILTYLTRTSLLTHWVHWLRNFGRDLQKWKNCKCSTPYLKLAQKNAVHVFFLPNALLYMYSKSSIGSVTLEIVRKGLKFLCEIWKSDSFYILKWRRPQKQ